MRFGFVSFYVCLGATLWAAVPGYVGAQVCATCHRDIAATQARTNMARTWHGSSPDVLPADYVATAAEGALRYRVARQQGRTTFEVAVPGRTTMLAPVEVVLGGSRHGLSFLYRVSE